MRALVRDRTRARDYDGVVHENNPWGRREYRCRSHDEREDIAMHGVWLDEPTTCLWCVVERSWR